MDGSFLAVHSVTALWHLDAGGGSRPLHQKRQFERLLSSMDSLHHERYALGPGRECVERKLAGILAADVVGYSHLMGDDEAGTLARSATRSSGCANFRGRAMNQTTRRHHAWWRLEVAVLLFCSLGGPAGAEHPGVTPPSSPAVLTLPEAAHLLRVGVDELNRLARRNEDPMRRRMGCQWRFNRAAVLAAVAANGHAFEAEDLEKLKEKDRCIKCDLFGAKLIGGNLPGVNLSGADLNRASLIRADLSGADLSGANLTGAVLHSANFGGAEGLTLRQLDHACGDAKSKLPSDLSVRSCPQDVATTMTRRRLPAG